MAEVMMGGFGGPGAIGTTLFLGAMGVVTGPGVLAAVALPEPACEIGESASPIADFESVDPTDGGCAIEFFRLADFFDLAVGPLVAP